MSKAAAKVNHESITRERSAGGNGRKELLRIAHMAMITYGLEPDFSDAVLKELGQIKNAAKDETNSERDLTNLLWCSIDNDDSRDLDQITVAEKLNDGSVKILVGVADVDAIVKPLSAIDSHAKANTTSVYTGVKVFSMLPEKLSTNLTSLSENEERMALVIEMVVNPDGHVADSDVYRAKVMNKAQLAYNSVSAWLEGKGSMPVKVQKVRGLDEQLWIQDETAQKMRKLRHEHGALELETIEPRAVMEGENVVDLKYEKKSRAGELIEDFMIGANGVTARFLTLLHYPTIRRVVRTPKRWERIVSVAKELGETLPVIPDSKALAEFLSHRRALDPIRFPDLSLTIVKLLGRGEYVLNLPEESPLGHFGLAVRDYTHSTAPNRRFPDLLTHRLLKAALKRQEPEYSDGDLAALATHCTEKEDAGEKVERRVRKSSSALFMEPKIGEHFDAIVTGASEKGTWARVLSPPVEGKVVHGNHGLDVGERVRVKLISVDVEKGFIDFVRTNHE